MSAIADAAVEPDGARDDHVWFPATTPVTRLATRRELAFVERCAAQIAAAPELARWPLLRAYAGALGAMTAHEFWTGPCGELHHALGRRVAPLRPITNADIEAFIGWADEHGWRWAAAAVGVDVHDLAREVAAWRDGTLYGTDRDELECAARHFRLEFADGRNAP